MKKLKLNVDALRVESFGTARPLTEIGTVAAAGAIGGFGMANDTTQMPDCDVSGSQSCGYTNCGNDTCTTCDQASWCGHSCILVCDAHAVWGQGGAIPPG